MLLNLNFQRFFKLMLLLPEGCAIGDVIKIERAEDDKVNFIIGLWYKLKMEKQGHINSKKLS